jgi:hypothetical protein
MFMNTTPIWIMIGLAVISVMPASVVAQSSATSACSAPEYHQFDFWADDWDVFDFNSPSIPVAHAQVSHILDNCVLLEDYRDTSGSHGQSFSIYDAPRKVWHQTWVTNRGKLLTIEGSLQSGEMVLSGVERTADGKEKLVRGVWKPVSGGVRETAVTSLDNGKTWTQWFDLMFRPVTKAEPK